MKKIALWGDYHLFVDDKFDSDNELEIGIDCDFTSARNMWLTRAQVHDLINHLKLVIARGPSNENKTV